MTDGAGVAVADRVDDGVGVCDGGVVFGCCSGNYLVYGLLALGCFSLEMAGDAVEARLRRHRHADNGDDSNKNNDNSSSNNGNARCSA
jgi:hypothetical protein